MCQNISTWVMSRVVCLDDFEKAAEEKIPKSALDYYKSGANDQVTLKDNTQAFKR